MIHSRALWIRGRIKSGDSARGGVASPLTNQPVDYPQRGVVWSRFTISDYTYLPSEDTPFVPSCYSIALTLTHLRAYNSNLHNLK